MANPSAAALAGRTSREPSALLRPLEMLTRRLRQWRARSIAPSARRVLAETFDEFPMAVVVLGDTGEVLLANPAAEALLGGPLQGEIWSYVLARAVESPRAAAPLVRTRGGRELSVCTCALPCRTRQLVLLADVTGRRAGREQRRHQQRLAAMGNLMASLAHQLRTPLATTMLYSTGLKLPREAEPTRRKLQAGLRHMDRLVTNMLLFARGHRLPKEAFASAQLLEDVCTLVAPQVEACGCRLTVHDGAPERILWGNRDAITTAIQNLITNAAQASGDGGTVRVHTRVHETRSIEIEVSDDGPGIPPQLQREIFAPFFSTRAAGAGLGLAVVQAVARAHDGDVRVRSRPGHGAAFSLILPALGIGESAAGSGRHGP